MCGYCDNCVNIDNSDTLEFSQALHVILLHLSLLPVRIACLCILVCHCDQCQLSPIPADNWCHETGALLVKSLDSVVPDEMPETAQELPLSEVFEACY